jgi:hypothetical protein
MSAVVIDVVSTSGSATSASPPHSVDDSARRSSPWASAVAAAMTSVCHGVATSRREEAARAATMVTPSASASSPLGAPANRSAR